MFSHNTASYKKSQAEKYLHAYGSTNHYSCPFAVVGLVYFDSNGGNLRFSLAFLNDLLWSGISDDSLHIILRVELLGCSISDISRSIG